MSFLIIFSNFKKEKKSVGFPGGPVVKNLPLSMQRTEVPSLVQDDTTCHEAAKLVHHN